MPSLTVYKSDLDYSYAPGIFPSVECLKHRPDKVRRLLLHSSAAGREEADRLRALAEEHGIRVEEADRAGVNKMYETNFFGPIALIQAVLPQMRARRNGAIVNVSSIGAVRTGAASGYYAATKAALELMSEGLAAEVKPLGIRVMIVEPGAFRTHFYDSSLKGAALTIGDYADTAWKRAPENAVNQGLQPGDPEKAGDVLIDAVEREDAPMRLLLGSDAVKAVRSTLESRIREVDAWAELSAKTDF